MHCSQPKCVIHGQNNRFAHQNTSTFVIDKGPEIYPTSQTPKTLCKCYPSQDGLLMKEGKKEFNYNSRDRGSVSIG